nr:unnamed protein product [Digitaria exilis]CAB3469898.1 unnamed protein product [Digitaria exilis]
MAQSTEAQGDDDEVEWQEVEREEVEPEEVEPNDESGRKRRRKSQVWNDFVEIETDDPEMSTAKCRISILDPRYKLNLLRYCYKKIHDDESVAEEQVNKAVTRDAIEVDDADDDVTAVD